MAEAGMKIYLTRVFNAPSDRVFDAWTSPAFMDKWAAPGPMIAKTEVDLRVGGSYRITMRTPDDPTVMVATGTYQEVNRPNRLVYTWKWEGSPDTAESIITVVFVTKGAQTEVRLTHERLPNQESVTRHEEGWIGCLAKLSDLFS